MLFFFFSSRRRHTRFDCDWSSDVCSSDLRSPAFVEKFKKGPVMMFTVMPGGSMAMGKNLIQWFLFSVVVGIFAALVAGSALPPGASSRAAVHFAGLTAFVA